MGWLCIKPLPRDLNSITKPSFALPTCGMPLNNGVQCVQYRVLVMRTADVGDCSVVVAKRMLFRLFGLPLSA